MHIFDKRPYIIATILAVLFAGAAFYYKFYIQEVPVAPRSLPEVGKAGSDHAHASLLIIVNGRIISFCSPEFMLKSQYVHFEDDNCTVVHRHAKGVTLPTFLKTIGVTLTPACITLPSGERNCNSGSNVLRAVINGDEVPITELPYYVFRNNDHILINYGDDVGTTLRFKYNQVPPIPTQVNVPFEEDNTRYIESTTTPLLENTLL